MALYLTICPLRFLLLYGSSGFSDVNFTSFTLGDGSLNGEDAEAVAMFADERKRLREEQGWINLHLGHTELVAAMVEATKKGYPWSKTSAHLHFF